MIDTSGNENNPISLVSLDSDLFETNEIVQHKNLRDTSLDANDATDHLNDIINRNISINANGTYVTFTTT